MRLLLECVAWGGSDAWVRGGGERRLG
jgi:hypothetical protein